MLFNECDFCKRLVFSIPEAWKIFQNKLGNGIINISKEASMQLQYAYILQNLIPLLIYNNDESIRLELEKTVTLNNGKTNEIDLLVIGKKLDIELKIAIEMKCYREYAASGGKRGATDIFMKDVYVDIEKLEKYISDNICQNKFLLIVNDLERLVYPKNKNAKCWDYDISNNYHLLPKIITTPIGGSEQSVKINSEYVFSWEKIGNYYFLIL